MEGRNQCKSRLWLQKAGVLLGGSGITGTYSLYTSLSSIFYTDILGISATSMGIMIFISKVWDAVNDIMCGALIDRTKTRFGQVKPWLFSGGILLFIFSVLMFTVPDFEQAGRLVWAYITYNGVGMAFTACVIGTVTLMPRITSNPLEQVSLNAFYTVGQSLAAIGVSLVLMDLLSYFGAQDPTTAYRNLALVIGGAGLVLTMIFVFVVREPREDKIVAEARVPLKKSLSALLRNRPFLLIAGISAAFGIASGMHSATVVHYLTYVMGDAGLSGYVLFVSYAGTFIASIVGRPLAHFDKLLMSKISFLVIAGGTALRIATGDSSLVFMLIGESCIGLGGGLFTVYSVPLLIDCALYGFVRTGVRSDGLVLSSLTFQTKIGQGLGTALMGIWLGAAGYEELSAAQPESAVAAIAHVHLIPYCVIALLCFVMLHFYSLSSKRMEGVRAQAEALEAES